MTNRAVPDKLEQIHTDPLDALWSNCRRRVYGRPKPPPPAKIYFDADRFRWLMSQPAPAEVLFEAAMLPRPPRTRDEWRGFLDAKMHEVKYDYE